MKRKITLLALVALGMTVTACGTVDASSTSPRPSDTGTSSSSSSPSSSEISEGPHSSSPSADETDEEKVQSVIEALEAVAVADSYTMEYTEDDGSGLGTTVTLEDIYTPSYISIGFSNSGYLTLPSYDESLGQTMVYDFRYDSQGNVVLGKTVTYEDENGKTKVVPDCRGMDYMNLFLEDETYALRPDMFEVQGGAVLSTDDDLLYVLTRQLGYSPYADDYVITSVRFGFDGANLSYELYYQIDADTMASSVLSTAVFTKLDATSDGKLQAFIDGYEAPTEFLPDEKFALLTGATVGFDTQIRYRTQSGFVDFGRIELTSYVDRDDAQNDRIAFDLYDSVNDERYAYVLTKGEDGEAVDHYIDGQNEQKTRPFDRSAYYWGNGIFSFQDEVDNTFLQEEDGSYRYYGTNIDRLFEAATGLSVLTDLNIKSVDSLKIDLGSDDEITLSADLSAIYYDTDGNETALSVNTVSTLVLDRGIEIPAPYEADGDTAELEQGFDALKNRYDYVARGYGLKSDGSEASTLPSNAYYLKKDAFYIENLVSRDTYANTIKGYKVVGNDLIPFTVDKQGIATQDGDILKDTSLDQVVPWNVSANLFEKQEDGSFLVRKGVKDYAEDMIGGSTIDSMIETSTSMRLDDEGRLSTVHYKYVYHGLLAGSEEFKVEYQADLSLPDFVDASSFEELDGLDQEVSDWTQEKDRNIGKMFEKTFGEEAAEVPYLYDAEVSNTWSLGVNYLNSDICVYSGKALETGYMERYEEYLASLGYESRKIDGLTYYVKGDIKIRFGASDGTADYSSYLFFGKIG